MRVRACVYYIFFFNIIFILIFAQRISTIQTPERRKTIDSQLQVIYELSNSAEKSKFLSLLFKAFLLLLFSNMKAEWTLEFT